MIAVRAHTEPDSWNAGRSLRPRAWPTATLLLTTVPLPQEGEPLWFGIWEILHLDRSTPRSALGAFHADDLPPADVALLAAASNEMGLGAPVPRKEFVDRHLFKLGYKEELPIAGWFLPEDLGRLAVDWSRARAKTTDGISLVLWTHPRQHGRGTTADRRPRLANGEVENTFRPRAVVRMLDGWRPLIGFTRRQTPDATDLMPEGGGGRIDPRYRKPGRFLTVAKLASSLAGERLATLPEACVTSGIKPPRPVEGSGVTDRLAWAVEQHDALGRLYRHLLIEHDRVSEGRLSPDQVNSSASYGKAVIEAAGVMPPLVQNPDFPRPVLAASMGALFGGETRVGIRLPYEPLPCLFRDYTSVYPVVASLIDVDGLLKAKRIDVVDEDPAEVSGWLASITPDDLLSPDLHHTVGFRFVELVPDGCVLPHRIPAAKHWKTQVGALTASEPLWYPLADALRTTLENGGVPRTVRAVRLAPEGRQGGLEVVRLPSGRVVTPREDLLFALAEERLADGSWAGAKSCANACCSGVFAQMNDSERRAKTLQHVWWPDGRSRSEYGTDVEEPARWYFPPITAAITAGARLLLHLACHLTEQAGGTVAYVDTDALAIVATKHGGLVPCEGGPLRNAEQEPCVRALSFAEVERALAPLEALNPYLARSPSTAPALLKIEEDNLDGDQLVEAHLHARSGKNYDRYRIVRINRRAELEVTKASEHGLGHLHPHWQTGTDNADWRAGGRTVQLRRDVGLSSDTPAWFGEIAISITRLNRWDQLARFTTRSRAQRGNGPRPFSRIAVAHPDPLHGIDDLGNRVVPVALWHDGLTVAQARWHNLPSGMPVTIRAPGRRLGEADISWGGPILVKTMHDVFVRLADRHDHGLEHNNQPTNPDTSGLVTVLPTTVALVVAVGRETHDLDNVGVTTDPTYRVYHDPDRNAWTLARDTLRRLAPGSLGPGRPRDADKPELIQHAGALARAELAKQGASQLPLDPVVACHLYLTSIGRLRLLCGGCGRRLGKRELRWCADCRPHRKRLSRAD